MRKSIISAMAIVILSAGVAAPAMAADVPFPTRIGKFVGHFDANGTPQSIVQPVEGTAHDHANCPECQEQDHNMADMEV